MHARTRRLVVTIVGALAVTGLVASPAWAKGPKAVAGSVVIYDATASPNPPNLPSLGYQATQTAEFGDQITFSEDAQRRLISVTVTMSDWAKHSDYPSMPAAGWTHPITLNLYAGGTPVYPGTLLATTTQVMTIPWRPEPNPDCAGGTAWKASNGNCYNGFAFDITFDLRSLNVTAPDTLVFGIAYDTNTWGYHPLGAPGPYESLNVGLTSVLPSVGTNDNPDDVFWNTQTAGWYADGGAAGVGVFREDTGWTPYQVAAAFEAAYPVPTMKSDCKKDGWRTLADLDGNGFKNQGQCEKYVKHA